MHLYGVSSSLFIAIIATGCVSLPQYREDAITTSEVIRHIRCEIRDAVWLDPSNSWISKWNAALTFEFEVYNTGGLDSENSFVFPMHQGATFPIALNFGLNGNATRVERIYFNESLQQLKELNVCAERHNGFIGLEGKLGIDDLINRAGRSIEKANINTNNLTQLDYNLTYVIKVTGNLTPKFQLIPIGAEQTFTGSIKIGIEDRDTQSLKIVLKPPAEGPKPTKCGVKLIHDLCPVPVYQVQVEEKEKIANAERARTGRPGNGERARGVRQRDGRGGSSAGSSISPADREALERGSGRNVLESIEGELRRQR